MNLAWLLKSSTIWIALGLSVIVTASILLFTPGGISSLRKRQSELFSHKLNLYSLSIQNKSLFDEARRLNDPDPASMESLVRRIGHDRPGEKVYVFGDQQKR
jgi:hypothetical protein